MAEQNLLKTPLNAPNQEAELGVDTNFEGWGSPVLAPTAPAPVQAIPEFMPQVTQEKPTLVDQKSNTVQVAVQNKTTTFAEDHEQRRLAQVAKNEANNSNTALVSDEGLDTFTGGAVNMATGFVADVARVAGNIAQILPGAIIDEYEDTAEIRDVMKAEGELVSQLAETADPTKRANLERRLEVISGWLNKGYASDHKTATSRRDYTARSIEHIEKSKEFSAIFDNVDTYLQTKINKSLQNALTAQVTPFAEKSAQQFKDGDILGSISTIADGIFTVAQDNPQAAVEMFLSSLPQMLAVASKTPLAAATVIGSYAEHVDKMAVDYEAEYGQRAVNDDRTAIQLGAIAATFFDFASDKVALKGVEIIPTKMLSNLAESMAKTAPTGLKTVTAYTTKVAGRLASLAAQPAQEFISGAGTELSEQVGVHRDIGDLTQVIEQGIIEAVAVSPTSAVVAAKDAIKATKTVTTDLGVAEKSTKVVAAVRETAGKALEKLEANRLEKTGEAGSPVFDAIKYSRDNAKNLTGTVKEAETFAEDLNTKMEAANAHIAANPDKTSPELLSDYAKLVDIITMVGQDVARRQELGEEVNEDELHLVIQKVVKKGMSENLSPESKENLKKNVLYSMKSNDTITEEQANILIQELQLEGAELETAKAYIQRVKDMKEVGSDVTDGTGTLFVGAKSHARSVQAAVLSGNMELAKSGLTKFSNFASYMRKKGTTFNAVWQHNRDLVAGTKVTIPKDIEVIATDDTGRIVQFTILDPESHGMTTDGASKVWDATKDGSIRTLANQVNSEVKVIQSLLTEATKSVNTKGKIEPVPTTTSTAESEYYDNGPATPAPEEEQAPTSADPRDNQTADNSKGIAKVQARIDKTVAKLAGNLTKDERTHQEKVLVRLEADMASFTGKPVPKRKSESGTTSEVEPQLTKEIADVEARIKELVAKKVPIGKLVHKSALLKLETLTSTIGAAEYVLKNILQARLEKAKGKTAKDLVIKDIAKYRAIIAEAESTPKTEQKKTEKPVTEHNPSEDHDIAAMLRTLGITGAATSTYESTAINALTTQAALLKAISSGDTSNIGKLFSWVYSGHTDNADRQGRAVKSASKYASGVKGGKATKAQIKIHLLNQLVEELGELTEEKLGTDITPKITAKLELQKRILKVGRFLGDTVNKDTQLTNDTQMIDALNASPEYKDQFNAETYNAANAANRANIRTALISQISIDIHSLVTAVPTASETDLHKIIKTLTKKVSNIEGTIKSNKNSKSPDRVANAKAMRALLKQTVLELSEAQAQLDALAEARRVETAESVDNLDVYELSKTLFEDTVVDNEYLSQMHGSEVLAEYIQDTIYSRDVTPAKRTILEKTLASLFQPKNTKELQSEEDLKDGIQSRNMFKTVRNFFNAYKKDNAFLSMDADELATVQTMSEFNDEFVEASAKVISTLTDDLTKIQLDVTRESGDQMQESPLNLLMKMVEINGVDRGYLDPNILGIMAMVGMDYTSTMAASTIYNTAEDIKMMFGKDTRANVSDGKLAPFRRVGTTKAGLADILGTAILKQLGIKGKLTADEDLEGRLATSLGLATIDIMTKMDLFEQSSMDRAYIQLDETSAEKNEAENEKGDVVELTGQLVSFVRVKVIEQEGHKDELLPRVRSYMDMYSLKDGEAKASISQIMDTLFAVTSNKRFPSMKPRKTRKGAKYLRTDVEIPADVIRSIEYAQSVEWRFKPGMVAMLTGDNREAGIQNLLDISGYRDAEAMALVAEYFQETEHAKNDSILREVTDAVTFFDMLADKGQEEFFYTYDSWNNSRHGMHENAMSPQASKIIRHMVYPTDPATEEGFSEELSMGDKNHMQMFKFYIAQALMPDLATDKDAKSVINKQFEDLIGSKGTRRSTLAKAGKAVRDGMDPFAAVKEFGLEGGMHAVDGLVSLAAYYTALKTKSDTFQVNGSIETDATTSGLIISFLNAGLRTENAHKKLAAGGVYRDSTNFIDHTTNNPDNYQMLSDYWKAAIEESSEYAEGLIDGVTDIVGMPERKHAKDPVMQSNYFANVNTLIKGFEESAVITLYEKLSSSNEAVRAAALESINEVMVSDNSLLDPKKKPFIQPKVRSKGINTVLTKYQEIKFRTVVRHVYGKSMAAGLESLGNEYAEYGTSLNNAGDVAFKVYEAIKAKITNEVLEEAKKTRDPRLTTITNAMRIEIDTHPLMVALYPRMKFFDTGDGAGIHAFKKGKKRIIESGSSVKNRYPEGQTIDGSKSTSVRITRIVDEGPGVSLVARGIQGVDAAQMSGVMGQYPIMHAFDAIYSPLLHAVANTQMYNTDTLSINRKFSIHSNAVSLLQNIVDTLAANPKEAAYIKSLVFTKGSALAGIDIQERLEAAIELEAISQENKEELYTKDIYSIDHMGLPGTAVINEENIEAQFDDLSTSQLNSAVESFLGSTSYDVPDTHDNFVSTDTETLTSENVVALFDTLGIGDRKGNSTDTVEHLTHLRTLLSQVIAPAMGKLGSFSLKMRRGGFSNFGSVEDNSILLRFGTETNVNVLLNQGSERTTYVHELVHTITRFLFDDPKLAPVASAIVKLRERTRKDLIAKYNGEPWKVFLSEDESIAGHVYDKDAEIAYAKSTYEYVFSQKGTFSTTGNPGIESARGIHEFMTYGLTDPRLVAALGTMSYKASRDTATTIGGKIQNFFLEIIDFLIGKVKHQGTTADIALIDLVGALNKVESKARFNLEFLSRGRDKLNDVGSKKITDWIYRPLAKATLKVVDKKYGGKIGRATRNVAMVVGAVNPVQELEVANGVMMVLPFREALDETRKRMRVSKNSLLIYILRTIAGPSNDMDRKVETMLARSNMLIDQARKNVINGAKTFVEDSFITDMVKEDWEALTLSVLKTDLTSLFPNLEAENAPRLVDILRNSGKIRDKRIADIRKKLTAYGDIGSFYIRQSKGLGKFMAKGDVTIELQRMNAYMIANAKGIVSNNKIPKDLAVVEQQIEMLATLYALENTADAVNQHTANIFEREHKANHRDNGIVNLLGMAKGVKESSLAKTFNGDKTHMVKGHIKSIVNPNISVKVALLSQQEELKELGYKLVSPLSADKLSDPSTARKALYSSDFVTMQDYNRGIISTTSMRASGTLLSQMLVNSTTQQYTYASSKQAVAQAATNNIAESRKHLKSPDHIQTGSVMVPVYNLKHEIVDFRYMMNDHTKLSVMKQDLRANVLLGALEGSIEDKVNTGVLNREALLLMKKDMDENFIAKSDEFIKISLSSSKAKHRELYSLLPEPTRKMIKEIFGSNDLYIDEKYIDVLFGQRSLSLSQLPFMNHRIVKIAEVIWKEFVSMAKKNIVIKTGSVLYHNIISNTVIGIMNGVPIDYMIKEQLRAARDLNNYMSVKRDLHVAKAELESAKGLKNQQGIIEANDTIASLESVLDNSPIRILIQAGLFQSITEEIDTESDPYSYASAFSAKLDKIAGKKKSLKQLNKGAKAVGRYVYMTEDTSMFKALLKATQYSDFISRQAVFKYKTEQRGASHKETMNLVRDLFVNYDLPDHQIVQYMSDTGVTMFTKYPMRMLKVIFKMLQGRPVDALLLILLEDYMGMNIDDPSDMGFNVLISPMGIVEDALTQSGAEMLYNVF